MLSFSTIITISILYLNCVVVESFDWRNATKVLKEKIKNLYKSKAAKSNESISVGPSQFSAIDFPRNIETLEIVESVWNDYYKCLKSKYDVISSEKTTPPYTIAAFTESYIQLECNVCASPEDLLDEAEWYFTAKPFTTKPVLVEEDEFKQISAFSFTLYLSNLKTFHQGMYYCGLKNDVDAPYFLHILSSEEEPISEVKNLEASIGPYPQQPMKIRNADIALWNDWTQWTDCSVCGKVGKRTKIGYCKVNLIQNLPARIRLALVHSPAVLNISSKILQETVDLLKYFIYGIPCRSSLLPKKFRENFMIKNFATEICSGFCKVQCPSDIIVEVVDKDGTIIDRVNNTAGEYSVYQELPSVPAEVQRVTIYADLNKTLILPCPNFLYKDTPIQWSVGGKLWIKDSIQKASKGRITLNDLNEIVFYQLTEIDLKIYSCFQLKELVGVVSLKANKKPSYLEDYLSSLELYPKIMFIAIFITFAYVSLQMCLNRKKAAAGALVPIKKKPTLIEFLADMYHDRYIEGISGKTDDKRN